MPEIASNRGLSRRQWVGLMSGSAALAAIPGLAAAQNARPQSSEIGVHVFNVRDFGAKGDGKTLDTAAIQSAINAATRDPRFPPVRKDELAGLKYSVDVLSAPEPCTFDDLDPQIYGVIVEDDSGNRRGLLLPALDGINTATHQIEIASRKAGILPGANVKLFRFRAERYSE